MFRVIVISSVLVVSGCSASLASLFIRQSLRSEEELKSVPMGWPFPFIQQDLSGYTPMSWPQTFRFNAPQEHPVTTDLAWFVMDVLFFSWVMCLAVLLMAALWRRIR